MGRGKSLKARIRGGESASLEFKSVPPGETKLARVIASFANSSGGDLVLGVDDLGRIVGLDDPVAARRVLERALALVDPRPETRLEPYVHELKDVLVLEVQAFEDGSLCHVDEGEEQVLCFRVGKETRRVGRDVEKLVLNLRRRFAGKSARIPEAKRLVAWLWERGEAPESACAHHLNWSKHRLRKLAEALVADGFLVPARLGEGRAYQVIRRF